MSKRVDHFKKSTFEELYWIPADNERRESSLFRKNKEFLRNECAAPCRVCGKKEDREVRYVFERAFRNALSPKKVTHILNALEFYDEDHITSTDDPEKLHQYSTELSKTKKFLDTPDHVQNLVVLCREHYRLKYAGVHTISFPLSWLMQ